MFLFSLIHIEMHLLKAYDLPMIHLQLYPCKQSLKEVDKESLYGWLVCAQNFVVQITSTDFDQLHCIVMKCRCCGYILHVAQVSRVMCPWTYRCGGVLNQLKY